MQGNHPEQVLSMTFLKTVFFLRSSTVKVCLVEAAVFAKPPRCLDLKGINHCGVQCVACACEWHKPSKKQAVEYDAFFGH